MGQQGNHNRKQSILKSMMVKIKQIKTKGSTLMEDERELYNLY